MHSIAIASILAAAATLTTAAPTGSTANQKQPRAWYVCANNGFRGECSSDPCAATWCPDYKPWTYEPITVTPPPTTPPTKAKAFYVCAANKFRGDCSVDPCALAWCPDYKPYTYDPVASWKRASDPTLCPAGTGFFQSCANGFRGCCKGDACAGTWCPDTPGTPATPPAGQPPVVPTAAKQWYVCAANSFRGECSVDPCALPWCPDYKFGTYLPAPATTAADVKRSDPTVCAPGTGFFQSCANGFRGCCKGDACGSTWCPDYEVGTFEPVAVAVAAVVAARSDPTVCAPGTGYFQSCANGFRGCCKGDACGNAWCPQYKYGTLEPVSVVA